VRLARALTEERRLETTAAELVMLEVAGHMLFLEQPEASGRRRVVPLGLD